MTSNTFDQNNIMNEKECEYCGTEFHAHRKDTKYCSKTCKNEAYLARKANPYVSIGQAEKTSNGVISSHNRRNVSNFQGLNKTSIDRLIAGASTDKEVLNHLLTEKDYSGDMRSEKSKLEIQLMFVERDLATAKEKVAELTSLNEKLEAQIEKSDSFFGRIMDMCEKNPAILMGVSSAIGKIAQTKAAPDSQTE